MLARISRASRPSAPERADALPKFSVARSVPYSAEQVFAIARDVACYREFVPLVTRSVVRNVRALDNGGETFDGDLTLAYAKLGVQETMTSRVTVDPAQLTVRAESNQGPVRHLVSEWRIVDTGPDKSEINFTVDYQLRSRTLQLVFSGMFDLAVRKIMNAFEERARSLYGPPPASS
jgi:coenzyme Q-binding protein COQ10